MSSLSIVHWQWLLVVCSSLILFFLSPLAKTTDEFFKAVHKKKAPNTLVLTGSLIISWIFAKSITNAANLGLAFGLVGGVAYSGYYLSFAVAGIIIYQLRTKGNYKSIHEFLNTKFGKKAVAIFSILIAFRLFNEVWSNTMVIGNYFGEQGAASYYWAIVVFTFLTLSYALKGGLSSSIFTDVIQMVLFAILLMVILCTIFSTDNFSSKEIINSGTWNFELGLNLFFAALLQSFSYPFHDPVLTDRGFITSPKVTRKSFLWAALLGAFCIIFFSFIGIYAQTKGMQGQAAVDVGKAFGVVILLVINFIMITSAASTLDSTFSSFSKLLVIDLKLKKTVFFGRITMITVAVLGTIPVFLNAEILSATTISGTMVIGLTPIFIFWNKEVPKSSFYWSIFCGLFFGILLVFNLFPEELIFTKGKYASLLWSNLWGILCCTLLYFIPKWVK
ncbi:sodium:solute symporter [Polaribacter reichenbachii]|uniref:Sodium:solute symporter n=1 Tax=Polaribacter reichenbachii TaxID=996801 RepID=A0A1B8U701_9FLAO|nr:sodium:solute symporter [Polaribacter reichenbachii]APZ46248.1 sodium:solute symporter [Polaribacter reichenbachii]AUC20110.1 sodium:solute symporter [Polaribacter reichenbachii]OBY67631.1 sodium:solute symporter [Polaribacter reichenbachii]